MKIFELKSTVRERFGKGAARALRRRGMIPAILYGPKTQPVPLSVSPFDLEKAFKESGTKRVVFNIVIENGNKENRTAIVKDIQTDIFNREFLHVDFYEISLQEKIQVDVPVVAVGEPKGFEKDGTLEIVHKELKVSSLPLDLPDFIEVDVTGLDIGDCIRVEEIRVREGVEILYDTNFTVVTIVPPSAEKVGMKPEEAEISIEEVGAEKEATDTDKE